MKIYYLVYVLAIVLVSCKSGEKNTQTVIDSASAKEKNAITFTGEQVKLAEIETGKIEKRILSDKIECTGTIEAPPQNLVTLTAPMGGFIAESNYLPGNYVKAGTVLAVLEHTSYIELQQEYLQARATLDYYKEEFKRQGELTLENAASMKKMQSAQSDYKSTEARFMALKKQLEFIGIATGQLTADNISSKISIKAPISGHITRSEGNRGKYIGAGETIYEMVDKSHLHASLKVFGKDVFRIKEGQKVNFTVAGLPSATFNARVELIGKSVDEGDHTVLVHTHITSSTENLIPGSYINASIILSDVPVYSLPVTSLIKNGNDCFLFKAANYKYTRMPIKIGIEQPDYFEILNPSEELLQSTIVTKGAYYIESELQKASEE
jgi:cobalt-zinc-cadmium efflux system membrane fusion protein